MVGIDNHFLQHIDVLADHDMKYILLFLVLCSAQCSRCPRAQPLVKVGEHLPPVPHGVGAPVQNFESRFTFISISKIFHTLLYINADPKFCSIAERVNFCGKLTKSLQNNEQPAIVTDHICRQK